jgi:alpha-mannosidase
VTNGPSPETNEEDDDNLIHVHFISHSHDDVGWLKHPVDYFQDQVQMILSTVVASLLENAERKFSQTEIYFFERWWN